MQMYRKPANMAGNVPSVAEKEITDLMIQKYDFDLEVRIPEVSETPVKGTR